MGKYADALEKLADRIVAEDSASNREKVLAKWPDAWCTAEHPFIVYLYQAKGGAITGGIGGTESEAWADAARRLDGN